ncbi:N-acetyltransferase [Reinekea sp.]|jgi:ribosomal protein S18 acetylase RimI-like enzyme|uniref:GNAT family N-acetyltransferase n=1 Tax=Reinekea sp. TaxID=1970455 RepID=UPI002A805B6D|nr:N-acetyltransferase [Reinekea sp.]
MIGKATPEDCLDLAALSLQVWLQTYATQGLRETISRYALSTFTERYFQQLLNEPAVEIWVARKEEHLVGYVAVDLGSNFNGKAHGYQVTTLYVSEHYQGQGIGRQLLDTVKNQYGLPYWLSVWVKNDLAINFYTRLGFRLIGELDFNLSGELHQNQVFSRS